MAILGVIPARYASTRFPGKPLVDIKGKSMLARVYEQAIKAAGLDEVVIATEDERIMDHADRLGARCVMTSSSHTTGTERCLEAYEKLAEPFQHIINIQGDEPFLDPGQIDSLAAACDAETEIATQMIVCSSHELLFDPAEAKIVLNEKNEAIYFSRSVIPYLRNHPPEEWHKNHRYYRHVGMYAYRVDVLKRICNLPPSPLEQAESLEQLRWLEHGFRIRCIETEFESHSIDSPADIEKVLRLVNYREE